MPWGTSASNTLKINKITIISFFTLCRNTTISFHNFVELIPVFKIYLYLCRIDYSLNNIITMKKRHYGMLSLALTSCLAVHAENKNQNTDKPNVIFIYADDLGYGDLECYGAKKRTNSKCQPSGIRRDTIYQRTRYRRYQYPIQIFHADRRICMA